MYVMEPIALQPAAFDVVTTDISEADLARLGPEHFGCERLARASSDAGFPARGVIWGASHRIFVPLTVRHSDGEPVRVLFLLDTASPHTFLRADTLRALGLVASPSTSPNVFINGTKVSVSMSHSRFANVDLVGADFLVRVSATVQIDYAALEVIVESAC